jgi:hypothetical protein
MLRFLAAVLCAAALGACASAPTPATTAERQIVEGLVPPIDAGGSVPRAAIDSPQAGLRIGFVTDPDGASIELLQHTRP